MIERTSRTRQRLVAAAADLISAAPGEDVPLRAICDRVGVKLPTLYHHFGSRAGLLDAVVEHGFDAYLDVKASHESSGDPIQDIRDGWDAHVSFGLSHPAFYALMYGQVAPGRRPDAQQRPTELLRGLARAAAAQGRLAVTPDQAVDQVLAANVGVTLFLITSADPDMELSARSREATLRSITGDRELAPERSSVMDAAQRLLGEIAQADTALGVPETRLLRKWLGELAEDAGRSSRLAAADGGEGR